MRPQSLILLIPLLIGCAERPTDPRYSAGPAEVIAANLLRVDGVEIRLRNIGTGVPGAETALAGWLAGKRLECVHFRDKETGARMGVCSAHGQDVGDWLWEKGLGD